MTARLVRLTLRRGQKLDLRVEKVPESLCRLNIDPDPGCDDNIVVRLSLEGGRKPGNAKGEVDHPVNGPATTEQVCEDNWHIVGVGDQASGNFNLLIGHPQYPQALNHSDLEKLNAKALGVQS